MTKIFLYVSALFLLGSGVLGFVNKGTIAKKQETLTETRTNLGKATADADSAKKSQKKAEAEAKDAQIKNTDLQGQLTAATTKVSELNTQVETSTKDVADKEAQITQLKDTIAKINDPSKAKSMDPGAPDLQAKVAEMEIQLNELKTVREGLETQLKSAQTNTDGLRRKIAMRESGESMNGLRGSILAVNHDWNFVVLNLGGNRGVNSNATMIVQRGGSTVGKVRITSVEPTQSIADIIPNSVPAGVIVQAGDTVVFPGI